MKVLLKLFSLKFVASLLALIYSILQVRYFGASRSIEIYFAAQSLVYLVTSLTQSGQLAEVFLPEYHKLNIIKQGLGYKGLNIVINRMVLFGSILMVLVFLFAHYFVDLMVPGFSHEDKDFTTLIFRILLPVLYLALINSFYITVLNAEERFGRAEFLGLTNTIVNILVLVVLYPFIQLWALVISFIIGKVIEFIFYLWQLYKIGFRFQWILSIPEFNHISFFKTMQSTFLYVGATQIYNIVLTASISFLPEGVYAIFKYVQNFANKIKSLFIQPFLTIFFTKYSKLLHNAKSVVNEFNKTISSIINMNVVTIVGTILLGDIIINLMWGSEKFDANDVKLAYLFILFNIFAVLISSVGNIYRKMAVANGKGKELYQYWVFSQLLSAIFSYVLIRYYKVEGLYYIIIINGVLLSIVSFLIYKRTLNNIKYKVSISHLLILLSILLLSIFIKYNNYSPSLVHNNYAFLILSSFILSIYPLILIYKAFKINIEDETLEI